MRKILFNIVMLVCASFAYSSTYSSANQDSVNEPESNKYQSGYINSSEFSEDELPQKEEDELELLPEPPEERNYLDNEIVEDPSIQ